MRHNKNNRRGFTLIEIMAVITIIAVLMGLLTLAVKTVVSSTRERASKVTLTSVDKMIQAKLGGVHRYVESANYKAQNRGDQRWVRVPDYIFPGSPYYDEFKALAKTNFRPGVNQTRLNYLSLLAIKDLMIKEFPQTLSEAGLTPGPGNTPESESAEALYYLLMEADWLDPGPKRLPSLSIADTDNDGLLEIVDAWDNPLRFYRWPTRLFRPQEYGQEATPQTALGLQDIVDRNAPQYSYMLTVLDGFSSSREMLAYDHWDEFGLIEGYASNGDPYTLSPEDFERNYHTIDTYSRPVAISPGEDGKLGFYEPFNVAQYGMRCQPVFEVSTNPAGYQPVPASMDDLSTWSLR